MCTNCLSASHTTSMCMSKYVCRLRSDRHHSPSHLDQGNQNSSVGETSAETSSLKSNPNTATPSIGQTSASFVCSLNTTNLNVLGTVLVHIRDNFRRWIPVQNLIDSGSQISVIKQTCELQLQLTRRPINTISNQYQSVPPMI